MLGRVRQLRRPGACARMLVEPPDTTKCPGQKGKRNSEYCLHVAGECDSVPQCSWVRLCGVETAFDLAYPLAESRPNGSLVGSHQPHDGSRKKIDMGK